MIPKINIIHGRLLEPFFNCYVEKHYPGYEFSTEEQILEKIEIFKKEWQETGEFLNSVEEVKMIYEVVSRL